jgi:hypothetical protein
MNTTTADLTRRPDDREPEPHDPVLDAFTPLSQPFPEATRALLEYIEEREQDRKGSINRFLSLFPTYSRRARFAAWIVYHLMPWLRSR